MIKKVSLIKKNAEVIWQHREWLLCSKMGMKCHVIGRRPSIERQVHTHQLISRAHVFTGLGCTCRLYANLTN